MKIAISIVCLALFCAQALGQSTTLVPDNIDFGDVCQEVEHCESCEDPEVECRECDDGMIMNLDKQGCSSCGVGCEECERDLTDAIVCLECYDHYALTSDQVCLPCGEGCDECSWVSGTTTICDVCWDEGYTLRSTASEDCLDCGDWCLECVENSALGPDCTKCQDRHFITDVTLNCGDCPDYCATCKDDGNGNGECTACDTGYALNSDKTKACLVCPSECNACNGQASSSSSLSQACTGCRDGYYLDDVFCRSCDSTCATCSANSAGDCLSCNDNRFLSSSTCIRCDTNCDVCESSTECSDCEQHYRVDSVKSCDVCPDFCNECELIDSVEECTECYDEYAHKPADTISCDICDDTHCHLCDNDPAICTSCVDLYVVDTTNYDCEACVSNCDACEWTNSRVECVDNMCSTGYVKNNQDGTCEKCPDHCSTNECRYNKNRGDTVCHACDNEDDSFFGRTPSDDVLSCVSCATGCESCDHNSTLSPTIECFMCYPMYVDDGANNCDPCDITGCTDCYNHTFCESCETGRVLSDDQSQCLSCPSHCDGTCSPASSGIFLTVCDSDSDCELGYVLDADDQCERCDDNNCERCTDDGNGNLLCDNGRCMDGFVDDDNQACQRCPTNCVGTCSWTDKTECDSNSDCESGYGLITNTDSVGECHICPDHCSSCEYEQDGDSGSLLCTGCDSGYSLHTASNEGSCIICTAHCSDCQTPDSATADEALCNANGCDAGYGLTVDERCQACPDDCDECTFDDSTGTTITTCDTCSTGHRKNSEVCATCPRYCSECTYDEEDLNTICDTCYDRYALDDDKDCTACPLHCDECTGNGVDHTDCKAGHCDSGYFVNRDKDCQLCGSLFANCLTCSDSTGSGANERVSCDECISGFVLSDDELSCIQHPNEPCEYFEDRSEICQQCSSGYILEDGECLSTCYVCGNLYNRTADNANNGDCGSTVAADDPMLTEICDDECWVFKLTTSLGAHYARTCGVPEISPYFDNVECTEENNLMCSDISTNEQLCHACSTGDRQNTESGGNHLTFTPVALLLCALSVFLRH